MTKIVKKHLMKTLHTAIVPLDLVKCRMQVDSAKYPNIGKGFKVF